VTERRFPRRRYRPNDEPEQLDMLDDSQPPAWGTPSPLSAPRSAVSRLAEFDGKTYVSVLDHERLGEQLLRVGHVMADGQWHTLREIASRTKDPEASISARLRDLRKHKFGGYTVEHERVGQGLWRYQLRREDT